MSMHRCALTSLTVASHLLFLNSFALAQACDPAEILRTDILKYDSNITVMMADVRNRVSSHQSNDQQQGGFSYSGIKLNYGEEKWLSDYISEQADFRLSQQEAISVLKATLSESSVRAYEACLGSQKLVISIPDLAGSDSDILVDVKWTPDGVDVPASKLNLNISGGELIEGDQKSRFERGEARIFKIHRANLFEPLSIKATIRGDRAEVYLPRKPNFKVVFAELYDPPMSQGPHGIRRGVGDNTTDLAKYDLCVISEEGILIPSTAYMQKDIVDGQGGRAFADVDHATASGHKVCGTVGASSGGAFSLVQITARLRVFEVKVVKLPDTQ
ncbi:hypothetical protein U8C35_04225 [Sinorhizobium medicae]|uniref:hypothetical protein n=1 Tax=Sinorhizobium medicae TaxID=110321 RepID=UPI002AF6A512|nr:hypothetical protein [Sinorhizobium medicae]WQO59667.1 hypothetical protein U8C35_04225 [Sinorhizobium medicae]